MISSQITVVTENITISGGELIAYQPTSTDCEYTTQNRFGLKMYNYYNQLFLYFQDNKKTLSVQNDWNCSEDSLTDI